jgi:hypothetical protein
MQVHQPRVEWVFGEIERMVKQIQGTPLIAASLVGPDALPSTC